MKNNPFLKKLTPYIVALVAFMAIPAIYFAPQFSGKTLVQSDIVQYKGMVEEVMQHREKYGEDPQWLGNSFSGMPAGLMNMEHDSMLIARMKPAFDFLGSPASMIFLAMAAFFVMLLMCGIDPWPAIPASIAYGLSTYFFIIIGAGHITKMWALAYMPLMLGSVFYTFRKNIWVGAALTAFFASLEIAAGHSQITYYFTMVLAAFWINEGIAAFRGKTMPRFWKASGAVVIAAMLAVGSNASSLYDTYQYSKYSTRGGSELAARSATDEKRGSGLDLDYATAWSYGKTESFNMFIPDLMGGASGGGFPKDGKVADALGKYGAPREYAQYLGINYWGDQPMTAGPTYIGAVIIFLCVLGLFLLRGRCKWWVVVITLIALMLAWGRNFMWFTELFFNILPGYNKFRVVAMILVIAEWSVPLIAALLLGKLWKEEITKQELVKALKYSLLATGGIALLFLVFGGVIFDFTGPNDKAVLMNMGMGWGLDQQGAVQFANTIQDAMIADRAAMMRSDAFRSLVFVLLTAGTVWLFALGKLKKAIMIAVLAVLVCADLVPVNLRYLSKDNFVEAKKTEIQPTAADRQILADKTKGFRVLNLTVSPFNDGTTSYFHRSVGGYHGAKMERYQDVINRYLSRTDIGVLNMLNTRYIIDADRQSGQPVALLNPDANGAAWFVEKVRIVGTPDEELAALGEIDTKREAVVDKRFAGLLTTPAFESDSATWIEMVEYRANYQAYEYTASQPGVAIFSEIYYDKGWTAYVDKVETPHFRADYILRGMCLPEGRHLVEFRYRAVNFDTVSVITLVISLIILAGVVAAGVAAVVYRKKKNDER